MKREKVANLVARLERRRKALEAADTPENEARLISLAESKGMKLVRRRKGACGFALKIPGKSELDGVSLFEIDALLQKLG